MMQLTDAQIACIRQHALVTLRTITSERITQLALDYQLSILEIGIASVLEDIVEALPSPSYKAVKQLLEARERLWNERYSQSKLEG